jgi:signal transduction histidine kinase
MRLRHIQLEKCHSEEIKETLLDENRLEQVFVNLLINAIQAVNENSVIIVGTRMGPGGEFIEAEIIDTGCGIAKENMDKIFEPFFRPKKKVRAWDWPSAMGSIRFESRSPLKR